MLHIIPLKNVSVWQQMFKQMFEQQQQRYISYHQQLLAFPVLVISVRRLSADAFELLLEDGFQHGISRTWTPCEDNGGKSDKLNDTLECDILLQPTYISVYEGPESKI